MPDAKPTPATAGNKRKAEESDEEEESSEEESSEEEEACAANSGGQHGQCCRSPPLSHLHRQPPPCLAQVFRASWGQLLIVCTDAPAETSAAVCLLQRGFEGGMPQCCTCHLSHLKPKQGAL
eukprot:scaffold139844_cov21-Tisochrysis_lutea.AAC.2